MTETNEYLYLLLESYQQEGKWIELYGTNIRTNENIQENLKIWDELMPMARNKGYKRAGNDQEIDELIGNVLVFDESGLNNELIDIISYYHAASIINNNDIDDDNDNDNDDTDTDDNALSS
jgi:hypothetical protein